MANDIIPEDAGPAFAGRTPIGPVRKMMKDKGIIPFTDRGVLGEILG